MSNQRSFNKKIVETDDFNSLPIEAQCLYFHLGIIAEDKGIIRCARATTRGLGIDFSNVQLLVDTGYLEIVDEGIYKITHWYINNATGETAKARNNWDYRMWRKAVIERDKVCQICGTSEKLVAHHIKAFALYPELRTDVNNGVTLCDLCHRRLHGLVKDGE